jgi:hypothetical protein
MLDTTRSWVGEEILGAGDMVIEQASVGVAARGTYNVTAMPPVARIPQRTVLGDDMMFSEAYFDFLVYEVIEFQGQLRVTGLVDGFVAGLLNVITKLTRAGHLSPSQPHFCPYIVMCRCLRRKFREFGRTTPKLLRYMKTIRQCINFDNGSGRTGGLT